MKEIALYGLYIVKDQFFSDFPNKNFMENKGENRPHYCAVKDQDGTIWVIPLSSQIEKYEKKILEAEEKYGKGNCTFYHVARIAGKKSAFVICDMFPILEEYIFRPYTISKVPYIIKDKKLIKALNKKSMRFLSLVKQGKAGNSLDVLALKRALLADRVLAK